MLECIPHWQILGGLIIAFCGGFWLGRQMACHEAYGKGKRDAFETYSDKQLKKILQENNEYFM
jgi:hypothetical protein